MFQYNGYERLQLWFLTPNMCAAFLAMMIMALCGISIFLSYSQRHRYCAWIIAFLGIILQALLVITYSRGGYWSLILSLIFVWLLSRNKWPFIQLCSMLVLLLVIPAGSSRLGATVSIADKSISNRLAVWQNGTSIIADHWLNGLGHPNAAGDIYTAWYQPYGINERYGGLINDYLNIAAAYGIGVLFIYLALLAILFFCGMQYCLKEKSSILILLLGVMLSYLISSTFSTMYPFWRVSMFFCLTLLTLLIFFFKNKLYNKKYRVTILLAIGTAFLGCSCIMLLGVINSRRLEYRFDNDFHIANVDASVYWAEPKQDVKATVVYFFSSKEMEDPEIIYKTVRPLLAKNYRVLALRVRSGSVGLDIAEKVVNESFRRNYDNIFLMGLEDGGIPAIIIAAARPSASISGVILIGAPDEWPLPQLSPAVHISEYSGPVLLMYGNYNTVYSDIATENLYHIRCESELPVESLIINDFCNEFYSEEDELFQTLERFIIGVIGQAGQSRQSSKNL